MILDVADLRSRPGGQAAFDEAIARGRTTAVAPPPAVAHVERPVEAGER